MFPNLFLVGAMKAGTSSLHEYLQQHPEIYMSPMKEPQYFAPHRLRTGEYWGMGNPYPEPGIDWYLRLFSEVGDEVKYAGESSTSYTSAPSVRDCEIRIWQFNPHAKIIYLLRDPIERCISHYWHFVADGREDRDPLNAFRRCHEYIARSDYLRQITPYIDRFGENNVSILTLEELNTDAPRVFGNLFAWLGVRADVLIDITQKHNIGDKSLRQTRKNMVWLDTLQKHWRWQKVQARLPLLLLSAIDKASYRTVRRDATDFRAAVRFLRPTLQASTLRLESLLGRRFPLWSTLWDEKFSQT